LLGAGATESEAATVRITDRDAKVAIEIGQGEFAEVAQSLSQMESMRKRDQREWDEWLAKNPDIEAGQSVDEFYEYRYSVEILSSKRAIIDRFALTTEGTLINVYGEPKQKKKFEAWFASLLGKINSFGRKAPTKQRAEQAGADQPATKPADKPPVKDQPSTPTSKDVPR
jgi:hypothetical protein